MLWGLRGGTSRRLILRLGIILRVWRQRLSDPALDERVAYLTRVVEGIQAAQGAIRQDVRSVLALLGGGGGSVGVDPPAMSEEELKAFEEAYKRRIEEAWEREIAKRPTGDELTPQDVREWHEGWAR